MVRAQTGQQCARNNTLSVCVYAVLVGASNGADNEFKLHDHDSSALSVIVIARSTECE